MQILSAKEAKTHFGNLLDTVQREPVLITRNNRPAGLFVSLEDIKGTHLAEILEQKQEGYDEWLQQKIMQSIHNHEQGISESKSFDDVHQNIMEKLKERLQNKG